MQLYAKVFTCLMIGCLFSIFISFNTQNKTNADLHNSLVADVSVFLQLLSVIIALQSL